MSHLPTGILIQSILLQETNFYKKFIMLKIILITIWGDMCDLGPVVDGLMAVLISNKNKIYYFYMCTHILHKKVDVPYYALIQH